MEPHSSASTWPKVIQRSVSIGTTVATASLTESNSMRWPVWNSSGSSSSMRNWLKVKPVGPTSATKVDESVDPVGDLVDECV